MQPTFSQSLLSKTSKDSVLFPKLWLEFSCFSCSKSFFSCWSASCAADQFMVTTTAYRFAMNSPSLQPCFACTVPFLSGEVSERIREWGCGNGDPHIRDSHAGRDGTACISFCARFSPGEMCFLCFYSYYGLQPELCASWIQLGLHTGWKGRI